MWRNRSLPLPPGKSLYLSKMFGGAPSPYNVLGRRLKQVAYGAKYRLQQREKMKALMASPQVNVATSSKDDLEASMRRSKKVSKVAPKAAPKPEPYRFKLPSKRKASEAFSSESQSKLQRPN